MIKKAMVMAAGVGSRLDPLTKDVPKPLVPVLNKPVMDILLEKLGKYGIRSVIANTYYIAEAVQNRYKKESPVNINFESIQEEQLSGTAGGVKKCEFFFEDVENFLVLSADGLHDANLEKIIQSHLESGCIATMAVAEIAPEEVSQYGVVVYSNDNKVLGFQEKPTLSEAKSNCINTGIYVFNKKIFDFIPQNTVYDFARNVFPTLLHVGEKINVCKIDDYWSDIGTIDQYIQSNWDALAGKVVANSDKIVVTPMAKYIVGNECSIEPDLCIEGYAVIGNNCKIGKNVCLKNVILWDGVEVKENVTIENSVIANGAVISSSIAEQIIPAGYQNESVLVK